MRFLFFSTLLMAGLACGSTKNIKGKPSELNGTWAPIRQEIAGTPLPKTVFEKQKLILSDNSYTLIAESVDKGQVVYRQGKMDIYGKEGVNAGKHFTAIYKYEADQLTICYNLSGTSYPDAFETKGKPAFFLSVFNKEAK